MVFEVRIGLRDAKIVEADSPLEAFDRVARACVTDFDMYVKKELVIVITKRDDAVICPP